MLFSGASLPTNSLQELYELYGLDDGNTESLARNIRSPDYESMDTEALEFRKSKKKCKRPSMNRGFGAFIKCKQEKKKARG